MEILLRSFIMSVLNGCEWSDSCYDRFTPEEVLQYALSTYKACCSQETLGAVCLAENRSAVPRSPVTMWLSYVAEPSHV